MSLAGWQINPIAVNFHLQKSLEIFDNNSADKIWSKKNKETKVSPLMSIRVNVYSKEISQENWEELPKRSFLIQSYFQSF